MKSHCQRCRKYTNVTIMSMFNQDIICGECKDEERNHPQYEEAWQAENASIKAGEKNFPGIGLPKNIMSPS